MPLPDDDFESFVTPASKPRKPSPSKIIHQPVGAQWSLDRLPEVETLYQTSFKKKLPLINKGMGSIHRKWGYDHRESADVGLDPSSSEGQQFIEKLKTSNVPFLAFTGAIPGVSTGPHIHLGFPSQKTSQRYSVGAQKRGKPKDDFDQYVGSGQDDFEQYVQPSQQAPARPPRPTRVTTKGEQGSGMGAIREQERNLPQSLGPSMQARQPGIVERVTEAIKPYVPGLTSLDTPFGIKTDPIRGAISGATLGAIGDPRQVSREEALVDPEAQAKANFAYGVGQVAPAVIPYVGAAKVLSKVPLLAQNTRLAHIARTALTFGGVETGREAIRAYKTDTPLDPKEVAVSTAIGAGIGAIAGVSPSMKRQVIAFVTPGVVADVARETPPEQAVQSAITNLLFGLHSGAGSRDARRLQRELRTAGVEGRPVAEPPAAERARRIEQTEADREAIRQQLQQTQEAPPIEPREVPPLEPSTRAEPAEVASTPEAVESIRIMYKGKPHRPTVSTERTEDGQHPVLGDARRADTLLRGGEGAARLTLRHDAAGDPRW